MAERERTGGLGNLLFPSHRGDGKDMMVDVRKALDAIGERAGWKAGEIRTKMLRHTHCLARLQTLDRGYPVSRFTVAREMGHGVTKLVERVCGHVGSLPHRSEVVEYRVENHQEALKRKFEALK